MASARQAAGHSDKSRGCRPKSKTHRTRGRLEAESAILCHNSTSKTVNMDYNQAFERCLIPLLVLYMKRWCSNQCLLETSTPNSRLLEGYTDISVVPATFGLWMKPDVLETFSDLSSIPERNHQKSPSHESHRNILCTFEPRACLLQCWHGGS